ncbi:MAG: hypothetical protein N3B13_02475 [Deltaproteobacteria bacterium]|nr:hypothetical protein [Deltaproteobacteria bacterium]
MSKSASVILLIIFVPLCLFGQNTSAKKNDRATLIVFNISPEKGVEQGSANLLTEFILTEIANIGKYNVIGQNDLDKMLFWETNKQLKNCTDSSCMAQIAGAMGAEYYVIGSVGTMGDNFLINLKLINVLKAVVEKRTTEGLKKDENELIKGTRDIVLKLFDMKAEAEERKTEKTKEENKQEQKAETGGPVAKKEAELRKGSNSWIGYSLLGAGVVGLMAGGYFTKSAMDADDKYKKSTAESAEKYNQEREDNNRNAVISYIAGGACVAGGVIYLLLGGNNGGTDTGKISAEFSGNYLTISKRF